MDDINTLTYEQAFAELDAIVRQLESDGQTLDESVTLFERGRRLAERCQALLDAAELRVSQLDDGGGLTDLA